MFITIGVSLTVRGRFPPVYGSWLAEGSRAVQTELENDGSVVSRVEEFLDE